MYALDIPEWQKLVCACFRGSWEGKWLNFHRIVDERQTEMRRTLKNAQKRIRDSSRVRNPQPTGHIRSVRSFGLKL